MSKEENNTDLHEVITAAEADTEENYYDNGGYTDEAVSHSNNDSSVVPIKSPVDTTFVMVNRNILSKSDFATEVRGKLDAKHYFNEMTVLLDVTSVTIDTIVHDILTEMLKSPEAIEQASSLLFLDKDKTMFASSLQGTLDECEETIDPTWIISMASMPHLSRKKIGIARLCQPLNFSPDSASVYFVIVILTPAEEKITKGALETSRILGTLLSDVQVRHTLRQVTKRDQVKDVLIEQVLLASRVTIPECEEKTRILTFGDDLWENVSRRFKYYKSDFTESIDSFTSINKLLSTIFFLFFSILFPAIAFGQLAEKNTNGKIDVDKAVIGQIIGGLLWSFFAGQPMLIIATTALVSLYSLVVFNMSIMLDTDFHALYAWVGLWSTAFIALYAFFGVSNLIKFSTRSIEEVFTAFITVCFAVDAIKDTIGTFQRHYYLNDTSVLVNASGEYFTQFEPGSHKAICLLSLILMIGTVTLSLFAYNFKSTPFLLPFIRNFISDYALPLGVIVFSIIAHFTAVNVEKLFLKGFQSPLQVADLSKCNSQAIGVSIALGFAVSILFFMDENITSMIINSPTNRMKKGPAPHLDILCIGVINCILSFYGLPWMHAVLPHSPLHVVCMADTEEQTIGGVSRSVIVKARETRVSGILCHILIGLIFAFVPFLFHYIPVAVLNGLFLYCAIASTRTSSFIERLFLIFTEQSQYPPTHYVRKVKQRVIHLFTVLELIQLLIICVVGFFPETYLQMTFPLFIAILIPIRHFLIPLFVDHKSIKVLDSFE